MPVDYILRTDPHPDSIFLLEKHDVPMNTWTHGRNVTLMFPKIAPAFVRMED
jgi:hypothetical protein